MTLWRGEKLRLLVESTTYCNAKCPQCSRTNPDGLHYSEIAPLLHVTYKEWDNMYKNNYDAIKSFHFSGQWGDCFMNPDIEDIFAHIRENSDCKISFSTNGSLRDTEFFWRLGADNRGRIRGTFDIDGWTQENHELYRRNTNLEKIKENIEAFAATTNPTKVFTVVFKHNQGDVDSITEWCKSIGVDHEPMQSNRFRKTTTFEYTYEGKTYVLEQTDDPRFLNDTQIKRNSGREIRDHRVELSSPKDAVIDCRWGEEDKIFVDWQGNVWPCCYWHATASRGKGNAIQAKAPQPKTPIFLQFKEDLANKEFSLKEKTLEEIMNHPFYTGELERSFTGGFNLMPTCHFICSVGSGHPEREAPGQIRSATSDTQS